MRKLCALLVAMLFLCSLIGCTAGNKQSVTEKPSLIEFTDSLGNVVKLEKTPTDIAVLFSSFAEIWKIAGGDIKITVGEAVERGFADDNAVLVDKSAGKTIDVETLIASNPDFVIATADVPAQVEAVEILRNAGIPCALMRVECFDDYLNVLKIFTDILGNEALYEKYGTEIQQKINDIKQQYASLNEQKRILFIRSGSGASSAKAKTASDHFAAKMLMELGAYNIADNAPILLDSLSIEEIIRVDPDSIFISTMGDEAASKAYMDSVLKDEAWQTLSAVKNGRVYYLPKDMFQFKPNVRWAEAYEFLALLLYNGD